jgi:hypothetical protein
MPGNREVAVGGGADRLSDLPDGILEVVLSFLPAADAVRTSVLSRRFRGAWAHAPALNLSDGLLQGRFLGFAREALARYGAPDIPALDVTIGCECNLGPATAAWLRDAMERAVESVCLRDGAGTLGLPDTSSLPESQIDRPQTERRLLRALPACPPGARCANVVRRVDGAEPLEGAAAGTRATPWRVPVILLSPAEEAAP